MEQMLTFCEISKRILNCMPPKTTYSSSQSARTICSLSPFFTAYFSVFLFCFHMQKYISSLEKHFTATSAIAVEVAVLLYLCQLALFLPGLISTTAQHFWKSLQFLLSHIVQNSAC